MIRKLLSGRIYVDVRSALLGLGVFTLATIVACRVHLWGGILVYVLTLLVLAVIVIARERP